MLGAVSTPQISTHLNLHLPRSWALLLIAVSLVGITASGQQPNPTPDELLQLNGFPPGLLPNTVVNSDYYSNGRFEIQLRRKCYVNIPGAYPVRYDTRITGVLSKGRLSDLSGITVKVLFVWWPITEIFVKGGNLVFSVGFASATFPATNFIDSPVCGDSMISTLKSFR